MGCFTLNRKGVGRIDSNADHCLPHEWMIDAIISSFESQGCGSFFSHFPVCNAISAMLGHVGSYFWPNAAIRIDDRAKNGDTTSFWIAAVIFSQNAFPIYY